MEERGVKDTAVVFRRGDLDASQLLVPRNVRGLLHRGEVPRGDLCLQIAAGFIQADEAGANARQHRLPCPYVEADGGAGRLECIRLAGGCDGRGVRRGPRGAGLKVMIELDDHVAAEACWPAGVEIEAMHRVFAGDFTAGGIDVERAVAVAGEILNLCPCGTGSIEAKGQQTATRGCR